MDIVLSALFRQGGAALREFGMDVFGGWIEMKLTPFFERNYWRFRNLRKKVWFWLAVIGVVLIGYHQDAIRGQWKFERMCKEDAGARFYGKIEKGQGWIVEDRGPSGFGGPFIFGDGVAFVRYTNNNNEQFDVSKKPGVWPPEYVFSPVNEVSVVRYKYVRKSAKSGEDERFSSSTESVLDYQTGALLAVFTSFGYSWTKSERVLLAAPTGQTCEMLGYDNVSFEKFIGSIFEQRTKGGSIN